MDRLLPSLHLFQVITTIFDIIAGFIYDYIIGLEPWFHEWNHWMQHDTSVAIIVCYIIKQHFFAGLTILVLAFQQRCNNVQVSHLFHW